MKKTIYYATPFVVFPIMLLLFTGLDRLDLINADIMQVLLFAVLFLFSALMGNLSPTDKKIDCIMTVIIPLSFFFAFLIALFFDEGCDGKPQLSLHHALNMAYYDSWLPIVFGMSVTTFLTSFQPIRIIKKLKRINNKDSR